MNIQRYDIEPGSESMQPFPDGEYIKLSDLLALLDKIDADFHDETAWSVTSRLRAELGAE